MIRSRIQWGLEYRTRSEFGWSMAVRFSNGIRFLNGQPFCVRFSNGWPFCVRFLNGTMASLGCFIYKENLFMYIKRPSLAIVWFSNGPDHSKTEQNGRHLVFLPFKNRTLQHSVFEWIRYSNVRNSSPHCSFITYVSPKMRKEKVNYNSDGFNTDMI